MRTSVFTQEIKTETSIEGSSQQVWNILTDFSKYKDWSTFILSIQGQPFVGNILEVRLGSKEKVDTFKPIVLNATPSTEFRWRGTLIHRFIFSGEHYFKLQSIDNQQTKLIHGEIFKGVLVPVIFWLMKKNVIKGFESFNHSIKTKVEIKRF